jgi:hypothetical protein
MALRAMTKGNCVNRAARQEVRAGHPLQSGTVVARRTILELAPVAPNCIMLRCGQLCSNRSNNFGSVCFETLAYDSMAGLVVGDGR